MAGAGVTSTSAAGGGAAAVTTAGGPAVSQLVHAASTAATSAPAGPALPLLAPMALHYGTTSRRVVLKRAG